MCSKLSKYLYLILLGATFSTCITPFFPEGGNKNAGTLVVEGDIVLGGYTRVFVSESKTLDSYSAIRYIFNATVSVHSDQGDAYLGTFIIELGSNPYYLVDTRALFADRKYFLRVTLENGKQFESDLLTPLMTPEIDALEYEVNDSRTAVDFLVSSYGDQNYSSFYKWSYVEDWEFTALYHVTHYYDRYQFEIVPYLADPLIYYCWNRSHSSNILVTRTDHLDLNRVSRRRINTIWYNDNRISYLYSIQVQQMCISKEAYLYWENIRKNTDEVGGIFAPQPSEVYGNIHYVRTEEQDDVKVLGYISAGQVTTKHIFVYERDLGIYRRPPGCQPLEKDPPMADFEKYDKGYRIIGDDLIYDWVYIDCINCTSKGTKNKPSFWPNDHR